MAGLGLKDKVAVVTGSSRGWGLAVAMELAERGVRVVINGTNAANVDSACNEVRQLGAECVPVVESVATMDGADRIIGTALQSFGRIDILINNAGGIRPASILEMNEEEWDDVIAVQLKGVFNCTKLAAQRMVTQGNGGCIINMAGAGGIRGMRSNANHAASKGAVLAATLSWAMELWPHRITINCVRARVRTDQTDSLRDQIRQELRRLGRTEEVSDRELGYYEPSEAAALVVWLASDSAARITGRFIGIDGPKLTLWGLAQPEADFYHFPSWTPELIDSSEIQQRIGAGPRSKGIMETNPVALALLAPYLDSGDAGSGARNYPL